MMKEMPDFKQCGNSFGVSKINRFQIIQLELTFLQELQENGTVT